MSTEQKKADLIIQAAASYLEAHTAGDPDPQPFLDYVEGVISGRVTTFPEVRFVSLAEYAASLV